jgi:thiol-disulfide isomerase/thioredoxin
MLGVCKAQTNNTIIINASIDLVLKNSPGQTFYLRKTDQDMKREFIDSVGIGNQGALDSLHYDLYIGGKEENINLGFSKQRPGMFMPIMAPGDHLKITIDFTNPNNIVYTGSAFTKEWDKFFKESQAIGKNRFNYFKSIKAGSADSLILKRKIAAIDNAMGTFLRRTIFDTKCANVVIYALLYSQHGIANYTNEEYDLIRQKFKGYKHVLLQTDANQKAQEHPLVVKPKPANGTMLASFILPDFNGKQVNLEQFKGKYVLVDFWASWCAPCRKEIPYLKKALAAFGKNNFVILSVSIDDKSNNWRKAINVDQTQAFIHLIDINGWKSTVTKQYNIESIPANFLLDPSGRIIDKDLRGEKLFEKLTKVFQSKD